MPDKPKLAVILGAGASHDLCPWPDKIANADYCPPLVDNMFATPGFHEVLQRHPEAEALMSSIRADLTRMSFETSIRRQRDSTDPRVKRQVRFLPVALREFFYRASRNYVTDASNYTVLIDRTLCQGIHTAFITTNYDTLLERSLSRFESIDFSDERSYTSSLDWMLAKLHGCVTWGFQWEISSPAPTLRSKLESNDPLPSMDTALVRVGITGLELRQENALFYPAMVLPADDKKGFMCPPGHLKALADFLADCENFLFIGFSANDGDLLDLLDENVRGVKSCCIVTKQPVHELEQLADRLRNGVRWFKAANAIGLEQRFAHGFSAYVSDPNEGLASFVSALLQG